MKHVLGKIGIFFLFSFLILRAEDFEYSITANKHTVYLKEPVLLSVDINQTNPDTVLFFHFFIKPDKAYKIRQVTAKHDDTIHHLKHHNLYEIYPLQTGDVNIQFSLIKRVTNEEKVRYFASGDRDDFKKLETKDYPIEVPPLTLHVKSLPEGTKLIGDFSLDYRIDTHQTNAFSPVSIEITLKGTGYPPVIKNLIPASLAYKIFSEKPQINMSPTSEGMVSTVTYLFALSAQKSYTLPQITLKAFSPRTHTPYTLEIPEQHFEIRSIDKKSLLDNRDTPPPRKTDWTWAENLLRYLLVFTAGYFTAFSVRLKRTKTRKQAHPLIEKIEDANTQKVLLQVLMSHEEGKQFTQVIEKLEASLYGNTKTPLKKLKKEALEQII